VGHRTRAGMRGRTCRVSTGSADVRWFKSGLCNHSFLRFADFPIPRNHPN
jgi:hypothetical protein